MASSSESPDRQTASGDRPPGIPRWLKMSALAVAALIVFAIAISAITGVQHGPGLHGPPASELTIPVV